jgi:polysaccharide export outer membrane protein
MQPIKRMLAALALTGTTLAGCASPGSSLAPLPENVSVESAYRLGAGDKLRIQVFGAEDMSGEFTVGDSGLIAAPLIGPVKAQGLTVPQLEEGIREKLRQGYFKEPRLNVEILSYRPFYIVGEVAKPGPYPYASGMTVLSAVAMAGGYTYRANENFVVVQRRLNGSAEEGKASITSRILPDDIIRVPERYF